MYQKLVNLQRLSKQLSLTMGHFTSTAATYRSETDAKQIKADLLKIVNGCDIAVLLCCRDAFGTSPRDDVAEIDAGQVAK
jgi:hypothetical protein